MKINSNLSQEDANKEVDRLRKLVKDYCNKEKEFSQKMEEELYKASFFYCCLFFTIVIVLTTIFLLDCFY